MAMRLKLSKMGEEYRRTNRCPVCKKFTFWVRDIVDGQELKGFRINPPDDASLIHECPKCQGRWAAYERPVTIQVIEGPSESEVEITQEIMLDNAHGTSILKRRKTITHEWRRSITVGQEISSSTQLGLKLGGDVASLGLTAENALKANYSVLQEETSTYSEELEFEVPVGVRRVVGLTFRRILHAGVLRLQDADGASADVPYKVAVGLELDVSQTDS
jgi:hypothetical protein